MSYRCKQDPQIMGILNVTPDSFSDGNQFIKPAQAFAHAAAMVEQGAAWIDVGGESTRPGADAVSVDEELSRIMPVIQLIKDNLDVKVSVDTQKPQVMHEVLSLGIDMINDVNALEAPGAIQAVTDSSCLICLMHRKGQPKTMQDSPHYLNVVETVYQYLANRVQTCVENGIERERLILDIGFGFGKTVAHNLTLVKNLEKFHSLDLPLLSAVSRKSTIGAVLQRKENEHLSGSLALAVMTYLQGASIFRVHDVAQTHDALKMIKAVESVENVN